MSWAGATSAARRLEGTASSMTVTDPRFPSGPPLNGCATCHRDMASLTAFDQHFERWDGATSCRDLDGEADWLQDKRGRWTTTKLAAQAEGMAERFSSTSLRRNERAGDVASARTTRA